MKPFLPYSSSFSQQHVDNRFFYILINKFSSKINMINTHILILIFGNVYHTDQRVRQLTLSLLPIYLFLNIFFTYIFLALNLYISNIQYPSYHLFFQYITYTLPDCITTLPLNVLYLHLQIHTPTFLFFDTLPVFLIYFLYCIDFF